MHKKFDSSAIEKKWQETWKQAGIYDVGQREAGKEKKYVLVEWPYPSGNLHIGHWYAFAVPDIYVRYRRMTGTQVIYPMGFDAFGLPAENAAIKRNLDPKAWTNDNIAFMRGQLESMGNAFTWNKTTSSTDPDYYRWTQWMFTKFFEQGIAYRGKGTVNWCPGCNTVIANEQVLPDGTCERSGDVIEKRQMPQWMLKITDYADRLIDDLDALDWPEHIKEAQRQWIGRSRGAEIDFALNTGAGHTEIVFASNNQGKLTRMRRLLSVAGITATLKTPSDIGIEGFDVIEDGTTLQENSQKKARALRQLTDLPVLADDSGFFIDGTEIDPVTVKRNALAGKNEKDLTVEEIATLMQRYYAAIATEKGGQVDAEWRNGLTFISTDGHEQYLEPVRPVILTSESKGSVDPHLPLRGLYISKATGKYVLEQTDAEELAELAPITTALRNLLTPQVTVFTTRADTLYGATYLVLAPEHPLISASRTNITNWSEVEAYVTQATQRDEQDRLDNTKEKTGVKLEGITATNPVSGETIPVFVADYVLGGYGTGAIMAVPAHDERDGAFAKKFGITVKQVVVPCADDSSNPPQPGFPEVKRDTVIVHLVDRATGKYALLRWHGSLEGITTAIMGGIEDGQTPEEAALAEIREEAAIMNARIVRTARWITAAKYCASHKQQNRCAHSYAFLAEVDGLAEQGAIPENEQRIHTLTWVLESEVLKNLTPDHQKLVWQLLQDDTAPLTGPGYLMNSGEFDGMDSEAAKEAIVKKVGGRMTNTYRLRDWSIGRQRYWGVPIPIVYDPEGKAHPVPAEHLPWLLPEDVDFKPTGEAPLAKSEALKKRTEELFGPGWTPEVETMDTFVDSSWYFLRYIDNQNQEELAGLDQQKDWLPVDIYFGGAEHTTMHLLYSRFWQKALFDLGLAAHPEPYKRRINRGLILGPDGNKMSKSKGNVIDPDEQVKLVGADTVKMYLAFMGPYEGNNYPWDMGGIAGLRRFLERVNGLTEHLIEAEPEAVTRQLHKTITKVQGDIVEYKFNTAISAMMIFVNLAEKEGLTAESFATFLQVLAPFAPHLTEELWHELGYTTSIHQETFPKADPDLATDTVVTIGVQINGKMRGTITVTPDASETEALSAAQAQESLRSRIGSVTPKKVIYVPGKILNLIVPEQQE